MTDRPTGIDPEIAFPLAIAAAVFGLVGLTVPVLAWVAVALAAVAYVSGPRQARTRALSIVAGILGAAGIAVSLVG